MFGRVKSFVPVQVQASGGLSLRDVLKGGLLLRSSFPVRLFAHSTVLDLWSNRH